MHTLPQPLRLSFTCSDRIGHRVAARVVATQESGYKPWVWRAVFRDTGEPPAELMGASESPEHIEADIRARVCALQISGIIVPATDRQTASGEKAAALAVADILRVASEMDSSTARRENLALMLNELGADLESGLSLAANVLGIPESGLRAMLEGGPISDSVARDVEWAASKPPGWLDGEHQAEPTP